MAISFATPRPSRGISARSRFSKSCTSRIARSRCAQNLAYFESQFGRYQEALKHHLEILAEGDNVKDPAAYLANLRNTAFLELKLGKYDAALRHYSDAYARSLRMQSQRGSGHGRSTVSAMPTMRSATSAKR